MNKASILVLDDEPNIVLLCKKLLTRAGYQVETRTDPRAALKYLEEHPIQLLLVDIRMPVVDGFEVITRAQVLQPDMAILIMTGHGTVETAIRALRQGVDGLILKPFETGSHLLEAVSGALEDSRRKHDAARIKAMRPLFTVTETLFSETRREPLLDLIAGAVCENLRCILTGCFEFDPRTGGFSMVVSRGLDPSTRLTDLVTSVEKGAAPVLINPGRAGDPGLRTAVSELGFGSAILVPVLRQNLRLVLFAARDRRQPAFQEADLELAQILASQAAVALENSRLYAEQLDYIRKVEDSQAALLQAEKMAAAGRLSASIAHEINNPLQSVQNCINLAGHEGLPQEKRREYFELARTELDRLVVTVRRMLDFYRPGAAVPQRVSLAGTLEYVLTLMSKQLSEARIQVRLDVPEDLPPVTVVESQIQQVFINLTLNAMDAMPEGGQIEICAQPAGDGIEILFQDFGRGIPPSVQPNVFEPFFSTKEGGTGLGLTVSYNIIAKHSGVLELVPGRGAGTCFRIHLPQGE